MNTIRIAMIQLNNYYNNQEEGFKTATRLIVKAASLGAKIVILPELSSCGYIPNQNIWQFAETKNGKTKVWASLLSKKYQIYIGAGYIEVNNKDFYNVI